MNLFVITAVLKALYLKNNIIVLSYVIQISTHCKCEHGKYHENLYISKYFYTGLIVRTTVCIVWKIFPNIQLEICTIYLLYLGHLGTGSAWEILQFKSCIFDSLQFVKLVLPKKIIISSHRIPKVTGNAKKWKKVFITPSKNGSLLFFEAPPKSIF